MGNKSYHPVAPTESDGQSSGDTGGFLIGASAPVMTPRSEIVASVGVVPYSLFDAGLFRVYKMGPVKPVSLEKHKAQQKSKKAITPSATSSQLQGGYLVQPLLPCLCEDPTHPSRLVVTSRGNQNVYYVAGYVQPRKFDALTPEELAKSQEEVYNMDDVGGQNSDEGRNTPQLDHAGSKRSLSLAPSQEQHEHEEEEDNHVESKTRSGVVQCSVCGQPPVEPWMGPCRHICCKSCWINYFKEQKKNKCPDCNAAMELEAIKPVQLCRVCMRLPKDGIVASCGHECCKVCWEGFLSENSQCPECSVKVDKNIILAVKA